MRDRREKRRVKTAGAWPALLAVLALLVQGLIPAAAMAYEARADVPAMVVLCTADGARTVAVPSDSQDHKGFAGLKCHDCVMASIAAVTPPAPQVAPVRYVQIVRLEARRIDAIRQVARPPPRPPSQGPPGLFNR
jgi:hypothetical protein